LPWRKDLAQGLTKKVDENSFCRKTPEQLLPKIVDDYLILMSIDLKMFVENYKENRNTFSLLIETFTFHLYGKN
jgi:hypothetical protein